MRPSTRSLSTKVWYGSTSTFTRGTIAAVMSVPDTSVPTFLSHCRAPLFGPVRHLLTGATQGRELQAVPIDHHPQIPAHFNSPDFANCGQRAITFHLRHAPGIGEPFRLCVIPVVTFWDESHGDPDRSMAAS